MEMRACPRCGGALWYDLRLGDRSCLCCGWVYYPPEDVAESLRAAEADLRPGGGAKLRRAVRLPVGHADGD